MAFANGHTSNFDDDRFGESPQLPRSESPLSEINDIPTTTISSPTPQHGMSPSEDDAIHNMATSEIDEDEDAPGEVDAEFDEDSQMEDVAGMNHDRSSSDESPRPRKRKVEEANDDEHMLLNPELYGLRRSGRARPSRRVIDSSDDESDDDVLTGRRRKRQKTTGTAPASTKGASSALSSPASDSEAADTYGGERGRTFARKHRRLQAAAASGRDTPNLSEVRFSTRRAAQVATYNEDDDLGLSDEDTENMTPNYWASQVDANLPAVDEVLEHKLKDGIGAQEPTRDDAMFRIKWKGQAYYHATWESYAEVKERVSSSGTKKLDNYWRKHGLRDWEMEHDEEIPREDKETWNLGREARIDELNNYIKVERVIGSREGEEGGTEYFVKWKDLTYDKCTYETSELVSELAQGEIDRFLDRTSKVPTSNLNESRLETRSKFRPFREQPSYIKGGELREFQIRGVNFLVYNWCGGNNVILADEMGLGKTVQTVSFINWLRHDRGQQGPFLIVVPLSTIPAWADTFNHWTPDVNYVVYNGNKASRQIIQDYELLIDGKINKTKFHVLLTTYEYVNEDYTFLSQLRWQFLAVDEAHRLKNRDAKLYGKLLGFKASSRLLITGTPMQNTLSELSALMDFLMPGKVHVDENIDLNSENAHEKIDEMNRSIAPFMIRRTKQKVENDLPPKTEKIIRVELSDVQLEYYKNILTRNYKELNQGAKGARTSLLNIMMELKKASNHPFMFPNAEERILAGNDSREEQLKALITSSGKMMLLDQLLTKMRKDNHRVLIFSQMVKLLDILGDYLQLRGYQFQRLDGTIPAGPRRSAIDHFNAPDSQDFCFLLSTRAGGLGINLMTADTVILFDSDWNPQADLQAMARAHRIGQKKPVTVYRLLSKDTVEEEILERARNKLMLEFITIQRGVTDKEARDLNDRMAKAGTGAAEPASSDDISQILKKRGQKMFEQSGNQKKLEELDIDAVLENAEEHKTEQPEGIASDGGIEFLKSFEYTDVKIDLSWDEIIPKDQLEKIKESERKREEEEYLKSVIEQNQPRSRKRAVPDEGDNSRAAKKRQVNYASANGEDGVESGPDDDSDHGLDPKRPLNEKECRNLIRAYERYGSIEEKQDEIIKEARLIGRDFEVVKATLQHFLDVAREKWRENEEEMEQLRKTTNKQITKKDKKAVLFDLDGVKRLNAETLLERPTEMKMLRDVVANCTDWRNLRIPEASKPASYTSEWGAKEDGMLCVGIARHGYGAWVPIRDDVELGLSDKFYLEEHRVDKKEERSKADEKQVAKSPGAVHLVRRANYLLQVLKDKISNGTNARAKEAIQNHHRNVNRRSHGPNQGRLNTPMSEQSPAPNGIRKAHANDPRASVDRHGHGSPNGHLKVGGHRPSEDRKGHHRTSSTQSTGHVLRPPKDETEVRIRRLLEPIKPALVKVTTATKKRVPDRDDRLAILKKCLLALGNILDELRRTGKLQDLEDRIWDFVAECYWPQAKSADTVVAGVQLKAMHKKLAVNKSAPSTSTTKDADSKPKSLESRPKEVKSEATETNDATPRDVKQSPETEKKLPSFKRRSPSDVRSSGPDMKVKREPSDANPYSDPRRSSEFKRTATDARRSSSASRRPSSPYANGRPSSSHDHRQRASPGPQHSSPRRMNTPGSRPTSSAGVNKRSPPPTSGYRPSDGRTKSPEPREHHDARRSPPHVAAPQ